MIILFFGDIIGKIGRKAMTKILPELKKEFQPDLVIANGENLAHGIGITKKTMAEMVEAGVDLFTSGNHIFKKPEVDLLLNVADPVLLRPANYSSTATGSGFRVIEVGSKSILVISMLGRVFMKENFDDPFKAIDEILDKFKNQKLAAIIVDFHAEATSEKQAFGWYLDGRVSAVLGTHTHVGTSDARILPQGTAYITDVGMVGATDSVIGDTKEPIIKSFLEQTSHSIEIPESGEVGVDAVLIEIDDKTKKAIKITRLDRKIKV